MSDYLLDILTVLSFVVGLENLQENITQNDVQDIAQKILSEIHSHLEDQDKKLERLLNENNRETFKND